MAKVAGRVSDAAAVGRALERAVDGAEPGVGEAAEARAAVFVGLARVDLGDGVAALGGGFGWEVLVVVVVRERRGKSEKRSKESTRGGGGSSPSPSQLPSLPSPPPCVDVLFQAASHTEVRECVHKTLAKAPSRALRGAAAPPGRAKRVGRRRWNRSGKQASGRRRHQMNALVKPRVEDSTGDSLRASRSSSIARRLHQRLGPVEAKRHHKGGARQGTAAWKKSGDGQCCSHSPAEKRPDRRLFPLRRGFAHHKVRVQDAKLDRLDALDGRRRVREAVQRRHRKKRSGLPSTLSFRCFPGCSLALSALAALSRATQGFSHVRARVHAQGPRCRRDEEEGRARESEMPCFFLSLLLLPFAFPLLSALGGGSESGIALRHRHRHRRRNTKKNFSSEEARGVRLFQLAATLQTSSSCSFLLAGASPL